MPAEFTLKHRAIRSAWVALALLASMMSCGCSPSMKRSVSLDNWQKDLDAYAIADANGDMSFLRDADAATYPQYAMFSHPNPEQSTDFVGVFLGRTQINQTDWLIFLLGKVRHQRVEEIRIAMRSDEAGPDNWIVGDNDTRNVQWYREYRDSVWRRRQGEASKPEDAVMMFPAEDDVFSLRTSPQSVEVKHEKSGAAWTLPISERMQRRLNTAAERREAIESRNR